MLKIKNLNSIALAGCVYSVRLGNISFACRGLLPLCLPDSMLDLPEMKSQKVYIAWKIEISKDVSGPTFFLSE